MNITLCSAFRNSVQNGHLDRYIEQVWALHGVLDERGDRLHCVWGEGDSVDDTRFQLAEGLYGWEFTLVDCTHGGAEYGSVERAERFRQLAHVGNTIFRAIPPQTDVVLWVESDLIWDPDAILGLIYRLETYPVIAPKIILRRAHWASDTWYDTLAFVKDGKHFEHAKPWHPANDGQTILQMDTVGSVVAFRAEIAKRIVFDERVLMGACEQAYRMGYSVWFDPTLPAVIHE